MKKIINFNIEPPDPPSKKRRWNMPLFKISCPLAFRHVNDEQVNYTETEDSRGRVTTIYYCDCGCTWIIGIMGIPRILYDTGGI